MNISILFPYMYNKSNEVSMCLTPPCSLYARMCPQLNLSTNLTSEYHPIDTFYIIKKPETAAATARPNTFGTNLPTPL
jgi:hypothetical protein